MNHDPPTPTRSTPPSEATVGAPRTDAPDESTSDDALRPGELVGGRYRVRGLLGRGGMGAVYDAVHEAIGRPVALKVMRPGASDASRFLQEARIANQVSHRNVVAVTDFGDDRGRLYLVMERLEGETLAALLAREGPLDAARAVDLLAPVLDALAHLHARGVVHRDLKPENVFLATVAGEPEPVPRLLDFGVARAASDPRLTRTGALLGTPRYASPEQCRGDRPVDAAADQYAAAAILYELLTGRAPHEAETPNLLLVAKITAAPPPLAARCPTLSPALTRAVDRALATEPTARFATIEDFREALLLSFDRLSGGASFAPASSPLPSPRPVASRRRALAAAAVVVGATTIAAWLLRAPEAPVRAPAPPAQPRQRRESPPASSSPPPAQPPTLPAPTAPAPTAAPTPTTTPRRAQARSITPRARRAGGGLQMEIFREPPP